MPATKKTFVVNLGDVRDVGWDKAAVLGLSLIGKIREASFDPRTLSPYVTDGGDVPLLILVEVEGSESEVENKIKLLNSIVRDDSDKGVKLISVCEDESDFWWVEPEEDEDEEDEDE
jgi:hypothetical protein